METVKSRFDGIIEVLRHATHERSKKKRVTEDFFENLASSEDKIRREKLYRINAQALILNPPTTKDASMAADKTPGFKSEPIEPIIPDAFKEDFQSYPIKGSESKETCQECGGAGKFDCKSCNKTGIIICPKCNGKPELICPNCRGSGAVRCHTCGGRGTMYMYDPNIGGNAEVPCRSCGGSGQQLCPGCRGSGITICSLCRGHGEVPCPDCNGKGYTTCDNCNGSGEIWRYQEKIFHFSPMQKNYIIIDNNMKDLENLVNDLPEHAWKPISEGDLSALASNSETAKSAIDIIKGFDDNLSSKDVKKRKIGVEMTESMILEGEHQGNTYTIILAGQAWDFVGKISNLTRGLAPQKDGTWLIKDDTFNSNNYRKELSKLTQDERKNLEKKLKEAYKEREGPQKIVNKLQKELNKASENADKLKYKLEKASEKKKEAIQQKLDEALDNIKNISSELNDAQEKLNDIDKKIKDLEIKLEALP
ncbi:MAG: hypothetical protein ACTSQS_14485 [Promethearchaeota archaeon]